MAETRHLARAVTTFYFGSEIKWDAGIMVNDLVTWFNNEQTRLSRMLGPLSPDGFLAMVKPVTGNETARNFQHLIYARTFMHVEARGLNDSNKIHLLQHLEAIAGHHCLAFLDQKLTAQCLSSCSADDLRVTFFLLVITICAISYSPPVTGFVRFPKMIVSNPSTQYKNILQSCKLG